ncbi:MAG: hypothetical protein ACLRFI_01585 [Alphaproteobacteria bacterium]
MSLFNKKNTQQNNTQKNTTVKPDFCTEYVIADPNKLMVNMNIMCSLPKIPVGLESDGGWSTCIMMPNDVRDYLYALKNLKPELRQEQIARTIVSYKLDDNTEIFLLPNFYRVSFASNKEISDATTNMSADKKIQMRKSMLGYLKQYQEFSSRMNQSR